MAVRRIVDYSYSFSPFLPPPSLRPSQDWPPRFDSYIKIKYFWFVFVFLNNIWVVLPLWVIFNAYRNLGRIICDEKKRS